MSAAPEEDTEEQLAPAPGMSRILRVLIACAALYTCHRALVLRIDYYDAYQYLANARAILGDPLMAYDELRPPVLPILQLPAMLVVRASPPGSLTRIVVPHCVGALVSLLSAAAVLWVFRRVLAPDIALLGTLLFVGGPYFVRYGAHVMGDLPSAGAAALTVGAYLAARERESIGAYALAGLAFGTALLTKFPLVTLGPALFAAECWHAVRARRFERRRWLGLALLVATAAALFSVVQAVLFTVVFRETGLARLARTFLPSGLAEASRLAGAMQGETWRDWGGMALVMLGPTLALAIVGLGVALVQREDRDIAFLAWLAFVGGGIVFGIGHNEARYLLPTVPAILYFAARGVEGAVASVSPRRLHAPWQRLSVVAGGSLLLLVTLAPGLRQAWADRDPVFFADLERRAAVRLLDSRRGQGRLLWYGFVHTFHPRDPVLMPADEYWNVFHFAPFVVSYFIDRAPQFVDSRRVPSLDLLGPQFEDGDAILHVAGELYETRDLPSGGVPPVELWRIRRIAFAPGVNRLVAEGDPGLGLELGTDGNGERTLRAGEDLGHWSVLAWVTGEAGPRRLADVTLRRGEALSLGPASAGVSLERLVLADAERELIQ